MSKGFVSPPSLSQGSNRDLTVESTLRELPLYTFQVETSCLGIVVAQFFNKYPLLPGVVLLEQGHFAGLVSRQRLLDYLIRPRRLELFLHKPLNVLYSYVPSELLVLPDSTTILAATQQALKRTPELLREPVVVIETVDATSEKIYKLLDVQELNVASWQIKGIETQVRYERTQAQMIQSEKMASLGRLVDGVAHEILDPVSFIWGNLIHVSNYSQQIIDLLSAYEAYLPLLPPHISELKEEIEFDYLQEDMPRAIASIQAGAERLKKLATSLQNFCHIDEIYPKPADLHTCIDSIILLLKSRLSSEIEIVKNYGQLPPVPCFISQLSQVFMNILTTAIERLINRAVRQKFSQDFGRPEEQSIAPKPRIEITTQVCARDAANSVAPNSRWVSIRIADNGSGMSRKMQQEIFESLSSMDKRTAKETSLSVSYHIITAKHGGQFYLRSPSVLAGEENSQQNSGTEFEILLPLV